MVIFVTNSLEFLLTAVKRQQGCSLMEEMSGPQAHLTGEGHWARQQAGVCWGLGLLLGRELDGWCACKRQQCTVPSLAIPHAPAEAHQPTLWGASQPRLTCQGRGRPLHDPGSSWTTDLGGSEARAVCTGLLLCAWQLIDLLWIIFVCTLSVTRCTAA